jgi:hypothetical protein
MQLKLHQQRDENEPLSQVIFRVQFVEFDEELTRNSCFYIEFRFVGGKIKKKVLTKTLKKNII